MIVEYMETNNLSHAVVQYKQPHIVYFATYISTQQHPFSTPMKFIKQNVSQIEVQTCILYERLSKLKLTSIGTD